MPRTFDRLLISAGSVLSVACAEPGTESSEFSASPTSSSNPFASAMGSNGDPPVFGPNPEGSGDVNPEPAGSQPIVSPSTPSTQVIEPGPSPSPSSSEDPGPVDVPVPSASVGPGPVEEPGPEPVSEPEPEPEYQAPSLSGDLSFSVPSGTFEGELSVAITTELSGEIRYTTDGTPPAADSPLYDGTELVLTETTQLRAQIFSDGNASGFPGTALYVRRVFDFESDIPLVIMEGYGLGQPQNKEDWIDLAFLTFEPGDTGIVALSDPPVVATRAGYHRRGQSSNNFPKTPYRVELWGNTNEDLDYRVLGMSEDSDWAMIGPCSDRSLIRNAFVYSLAADMGLSAMKLAFAEVFINYDGGPLEETDYEGVYAVTQTIKNQKSRLDLKQLEEADTALPDITGGYIFKFDQAAVDEGEVEILCVGDDPVGGGNPFAQENEGGTCWDDLEIVDPSPANTEQLEWIAAHLQEFHDTMHAEPLGDYMAWIDVQSFVDHFIINEITRDVDAYIRSHFMHKDRDGLITAGPVWDYNFALGNVGSDLEGWQWEDGRVGSNDWHRIMGSDPEFQALMAARWQELRPTILSDAELDARIDQIAAPLINAGPRDVERWPVGECGFFGGFGPPGDPEEPEPEEPAPPPTWESQVQALKDWTHERMLWLDTQLL